MAVRVSEIRTAGQDARSSRAADPGKKDRRGQGTLPSPCEDRSRYWNTPQGKSFTSENFQHRCPRFFDYWNTPQGKSFTSENFQHRCPRFFDYSSKVFSLFFFIQGCFTDLIASTIGMGKRKYEVSVGRSPELACGNTPLSSRQSSGSIWPALLFDETLGHERSVRKRRMEGGGRGVQVGRRKMEVERVGTFT